MPFNTQRIARTHRVDAGVHDMEPSMLSLAIKPGEHVVITDNVQSIRIFNTDARGIRVAIEASLEWSIVRSDAKNKKGHEDGNELAAVS